MARILTHEELMLRPQWAEELAALTRAAWTGPDGTFYFPYRPLGDPEFWRERVLDDWTQGRMRSWAVVDGDRVAAHAALVRRDGHWELGRLMSSRPPRGAVVTLCEERMRFVRAHGLRVVAECTQSHNRTQHLSARFGLRFAGIGILERVGDLSWDIVYFDNHGAPPFVPRPGVLADPLGRELRCEENHRARLREIPAILATGHAVELPPRHFNVLPELVEPVLRIVSLNL